MLSYKEICDAQENHKKNEAKEKQVEHEGNKLLEELEQLHQGLRGKNDVVKAEAKLNWLEERRALAEKVLSGAEVSQSERLVCSWWVIWHYDVGIMEQNFKEKHNCVNCMPDFVGHAEKANELRLPLPSLFKSKDSFFTLLLFKICDYARARGLEDGIFNGVFNQHFVDGAGQVIEANIKPLPGNLPALLLEFYFKSQELQAEKENSWSPLIAIGNLANSYGSKIGTRFTKAEKKAAKEVKQSDKDKG